MGKLADMFRSHSGMVKAPEAPVELSVVDNYAMRYNIVANVMKREKGREIAQSYLGEDARLSDVNAFLDYAVEREAFEQKNPGVPYEGKTGSLRYGAVSGRENYDEMYGEYMDYKRQMEEVMFNHLNGKNVRPGTSRNPEYDLIQEKFEQTEDLVLRAADGFTSMEAEKYGSQVRYVDDISMGGTSEFKDVYKVMENAVRNNNIRLVGNYDKLTPEQQDEKRKDVAETLRAEREAYMEAHRNDQVSLDTKVPKTKGIEPPQIDTGKYEKAVAELFGGNKESLEPTQAAPGGFEMP